MVDQRAVAAPDVEHPSTRRDHAGDHREIDPHVFGEETNRVECAHSPQARVDGAPAEKTG